MTTRRNLGFSISDDRRDLDFVVLDVDVTPELDAEAVLTAVPSIALTFAALAAQYPTWNDLAGSGTWLDVRARLLRGTVT